MFISDLLSIQQIIPNLKATSKKQALTELACFAGAQLGIEQQIILDGLYERERLGSTGVGHGVAVPHAKLSELDKIYVILARLKNPIDFQSVDNLKVNVVMMILSPEEAGGDYLTVLASTARLFHDERTLAHIRGSESADAILAVINEFDHKGS